MTDELPAPLRRVRTTLQARATAGELHDQAIRDAEVAGLPIIDIARAIGVSNRQRVYAVLEKPPVPPESPPTLSPAAFLRGAGADRETWDAIEYELHLRGIVTVRDRTTAWHLARGGVPVVLVDFSVPKSGRLAKGAIGLVTARNRVTETTKPVSALLRRADRDRFAGEPWLATEVETEERDPELPWVSPADKVEFDSLRVDPEQLARHVLDALDNTPSRRPAPKTKEHISD